jgi:hypothetical protein
MKPSSALSCSSGCSEHFFLKLREQRFAFSKAFKKDSFAIKKVLVLGVWLEGEVIVGKRYGVDSSQSGEGKLDSK